LLVQVEPSLLGDPGKRLEEEMVQCTSGRDHLASQ
jgi:hypothetical protein